MEAIRGIQAGVLEAMPTVDRDGSMQPSQHSGGLTQQTGLTHEAEAMASTRRGRIRRWMVALGLARRETLGDVELLTYSRGLEEFPDEAISEVLRRLARTPRVEFEPKIPELGDLIAMVRAEARKMNPWVPCGRCNSGMLLHEVDGQRWAERCECWLRWKRAGKSNASELRTAVLEG